MKFRLVDKLYGEELPGLGFGLALWPWLCGVWLSHRHLSLLFPKPIAAFLKETGSWTKNQTLTSFEIRFCFSSLPLICPSSWILSCLICLQKACVVSVVVRWKRFILCPAAPALPITAPFSFHWGFCGTTPKLKACSFTFPFASAHVVLQTYVKKGCLFKLRPSDTSKYAKMGPQDIPSGLAV